jgi:hypothetical protein
MNIDIEDRKLNYSQKIDAVFFSYIGMSIIAAAAVLDVSSFIILIIYLFNDLC